MENRGLIFIPDISGFTQFVNRVEIEHSKLIIQELLEILVSSNEIGLEISEIEGDAILFYKYGESPDPEALYRQVEKMFCEFHRSLIAYEVNKYCQCDACMSAIELTLKVVTHFGEFTDYQVRNFKKLIGKDVIVAHQLLKNDIDHHEYWLVTDGLVKDNLSGKLTSPLNWNNSVKHTENGDIQFYYAQLGDLKDKISKDVDLPSEILNKVKMASVSEDFETDIITLFRTAGMFEYRPRWRDGVEAMEELTHFLPRIGMKGRVISDEGESIIYSSSYSFHPEKIFFSETDEKKENCTYYLIEKIDDNKTRLTLEYYVKKNALSNLGFRLKKKKKLETSMQKSLANIKELVKVIEFPY